MQVRMMKQNQFEPCQKEQNSTDITHGDLEDIPKDVNALDDGDKKQVTMKIHSDLHTNHKTRKNSKRKRCRHCSKVFDNHLKLMRHLEEEIKATRFPCHICKQNFPTWKTYDLHKCTGSAKGSDKGNKYICVCAYCGRIFYSERVLNDHNKTKSKACNICNEVFCTLTAMRQHKMKHVQLYKCNTCSLTFRFEVGLRKHLAQGHVTYKCNFCDTRCMCRWSMVTHVKKQHPEIANSFDKRVEVGSERNEKCINESVSEREETDAAIASISNVTETDTFMDNSTESAHKQIDSVWRQEEVDEADSMLNFTYRAVGESKMIEECSDLYTFENRDKSGLSNLIESAAAIASITADTIETYEFKETTDSFEGLEVFHDLNGLKYETYDGIQCNTVQRNWDETKQEGINIPVHRMPKTESTDFQDLDQTITAVDFISENTDKDEFMDSSYFKKEQYFNEQIVNGRYNRESDISESCTDMFSSIYPYSMKDANFKRFKESSTLPDTGNRESMEPESKQRYTVSEPTMKVFSDMSDEFVHTSRKRNKINSTMTLPNGFNIMSVDEELVRNNYTKIEGKDGMETENIYVEDHLRGNLNKTNQLSKDRFQMASKPVISDSNGKINSFSKKPEFMSEKEKCILTRSYSGHKQKVSINQIKIENVENNELISVSASKEVKEENGMETRNVYFEENLHGNLNKTNELSEERFQITSKPISTDSKGKINSYPEKSKTEKCVLTGSYSGLEENVDICQIKIENVENNELISLSSSRELKVKTGMETDNIYLEERWRDNLNKTNELSEERFQIAGKPITPYSRVKINSSSDNPVYSSANEKCVLSRSDTGHEEWANTCQVKVENIENNELITQSNSRENEAKPHNNGINIPSRTTENFEKDITPPENESSEDWDEHDVEEIVLRKGFCESSSDGYDCSISYGNGIDNLVQVDEYRDEISSRKTVRSGKSYDAGNVFGDDPNRRLRRKRDTACVNSARKGKCKKVGVTVSGLQSDNSSDSDSNEDSDGYEECTAEEIQEMLSSL